MDSNKVLRLFLSGLGVMVLSLVLLHPAGSAFAASATSTRIPLYFIRSADCNAEDVEISGTLHLLNKTQADGSVSGHFNYQNVRGVGLTSGTLYQVSAVDDVKLSAPFPSSIHSEQSFHLISQGSASNLMVHVIYHITVNANGEVTASIDEFNMQCT